MSGEWRRLRAFGVVALTSVGVLIAPSVSAAAPSRPGRQFDYRITASCSGPAEGCVNAKTVDVIPAGVTIEVPPPVPPQPRPGARLRPLPNPRPRHRPLPATGAAVLFPAALAVAVALAGAVMLVAAGGRWRQRREDRD